MDFCINCKNFLFIKEKDEDCTGNSANDNKEELEKQIIYYCLKCNYQKNVENNCIYKKIYKKSSNLYKNHKFLNYDVTLPRKLTTCPSCKVENDNVYYQRNNLSIIFTCKNCSHFWNNN